MMGNISNSTQTSVATSVTAWSNSQPYAAGQLVVGSDGNTYYANTALAAGQLAPTAGGPWTPIVSSVASIATVASFVANKSYATGSLVFGPDGNLYTANGAINAATFTTGIAGTASTWTQVNCPAGYQNASPTTWTGVSAPAYIQGQTVNNGGVIYKANGAIAANTATFPIGTTGSTWAIVSQVTSNTSSLALWSASGTYTNGQQVIYTDGNIYQANGSPTVGSFNTTLLSTAGTWTQINCPIGTATGASAWNNTTAYVLNQTVKYLDNVVYKCAVAGSGAWNYANWVVVSPSALTTDVLAYNANVAYPQGSLVMWQDAAGATNLWLANSNIAANIPYFPTGVLGTANTFTQINCASGVQTSAQAFVSSGVNGVYALGQTVSNTGAVYKCIAAIGTAAAFNPAQWVQVSPVANVTTTPTIAQYQANTGYAAGQLVIYTDGNIYMSTGVISNTASWTTGTPTTANVWTQITFSNQQAVLWNNGSAAYAAGATVKLSATDTFSFVANSGGVANGTLTFTVDQTGAAANSWSLVTNVPSTIYQGFSSSLSYPPGALMVYTDNNVYRANAYIPAGSPFITVAPNYTPGTGLKSWTQVNVGSAPLSQLVTGLVYSASATYTQGQVVLGNDGYYYKATYAIAAGLGDPAVAILSTTVACYWAKLPGYPFTYQTGAATFSPTATYTQGMTSLAQDGQVYMSLSNISPGTDPSILLNQNVPTSNNWKLISPQQSVVENYPYGTSIASGSPVMIVAMLNGVLSNANNAVATVMPLKSNPVAGLSINTGGLTQDITQITGNTTSALLPLVTASSGIGPVKTDGPTTNPGINSTVFAAWQATSTAGSYVVNFFTGAGVQPAANPKVTLSGAAGYYAEDGIASGSGIFYTLNSPASTPLPAICIVGRSDTASGYQLTPLASAGFAPPNTSATYIKACGLSIGGVTKALVMLGNITVASNLGNYGFCTVTINTSNPATPTATYDSGSYVLGTTSASGSVPATYGNQAVSSSLIQLTGNTALFLRRPTSNNTAGATYASIITVTGTTISQGPEVVVTDATNDAFVQVQATLVDSVLGVVALFCRNASSVYLIRLLTCGAPTAKYPSGIYRSYGDTQTSLTQPGGASTVSFFNIVSPNNRTLWLSISEGGVANATITATSRQYANFDPTNTAQPITMGSFPTVGATTENANGVVNANTMAFAYSPVSGTMLWAQVASAGQYWVSYYNFSGTGNIINPSAFAGIAQATTNGPSVAPLPVVTTGVASVSGLVTGANYYIQYNTGNLDTIYTPVTVGKALNPNQLLVDANATQTTSSIIQQGLNPQIPTWVSGNTYTQGNLVVNPSDSCVYYVNSTGSNTTFNTSAILGTANTYTLVSVPPNYAPTATAFSTSATYVVGQTVKYTDGYVYKCTTAITVAGAWTGSANWVLYSSQNQVPFWVQNASISYPTGQLVTYTDGNVYVAVQAVPANTAFSPTYWCEVNTEWTVQDYIPVGSANGALASVGTGNLATNPVSYTSASGVYLLGGAYNSSSTGGNVGSLAALGIPMYVTKVAATLNVTSGAVQIGVAAVNSSTLVVNRISSTVAVNSTSVATAGVAQLQTLPTPFYVYPNEIVMLYVNFTAGGGNAAQFLLNSNDAALRFINNGFMSNFSAITLGTSTVTPNASSWNTPWCFEAQSGQNPGNIQAWNIASSYNAGDTAMYTDGQVYTALYPSAANTAWSFNNWKPVKTNAAGIIGMPGSTSTLNAASTYNVVTATGNQLFGGGYINYSTNTYAGYNAAVYNSGWVTQVGVAWTIGGMVGLAAVNISSGLVVRVSTTAYVGPSTNATSTFGTLPTPFYVNAGTEYLLLYVPTGNSGSKFFVNTSSTITGTYVAKTGSVIGAAANSATSNACIPWSYTLATFSRNSANVPYYSAGLSYNNNDLVTNPYDNLVYRANAPIAAGTPFAIGYTGATWTRIDNGNVTSLFTSRALTAYDHNQTLTTSDSGVANNNKIAGAINPVLGSNGWYANFTTFAGSANVTSTSGSNILNITGASGSINVGYAIGEGVNGANLPANTVVTGWAPTSATSATFTLSNNASASGLFNMTLQASPNNVTAKFILYNVQTTTGSSVLTFSGGAPAGIAAGDVLNALSGSSLPVNATVSSTSANSITMNTAATATGTVTLGIGAKTNVLVCSAYSITLGTPWTGGSTITLPAATSTAQATAYATIAAMVASGGPILLVAANGGGSAFINSFNVVTLAMTLSSALTGSITNFTIGGLYGPLLSNDITGTPTNLASRMSFSSGSYLYQNFTTGNIVEVEVWVKQASNVPSGELIASNLWISVAPIAAGSKYVTLTSSWQKVTIAYNGGTNYIRIGAVDYNNIADNSCVGAVDVYYPQVVTAQTASVPNNLPIGFTAKFYGPVTFANSFTQGQANQNAGSEVEIRDMRVYNSQGYSYAQLSNVSGSNNEYIVTGQTPFVNNTQAFSPASSLPLASVLTTGSNTINVPSSLNIPIGTTVNAPGLNPNVIVNAVAGGAVTLGTPPVMPVLGTYSNSTAQVPNALSIDIPGAAGTIPAPPSPDHIMFGSGWKRGSATIVANNFNSLQALATAVNARPEFNVTIDFTGCHDLPVQNNPTLPVDVYFYKNVMCINGWGVNIYSNAPGTTGTTTATWNLGTSIAAPTSNSGYCGYTIAGSTVLTTFVDISASVTVGALVSMPGFPANSYVVSVAGTSITLSQPATGSTGTAARNVNITNSNNTLTFSDGTAPNTLLIVGQLVNGPGIPANSLVTAVTATSFTINNNCTATTSNVNMIWKGLSISTNANNIVTLANTSNVGIGSIVTDGGTNIPTGSRVQYIGANGLVYLTNGLLKTSGTNVPMYVQGAGNNAITWVASAAYAAGTRVLYQDGWVYVANGAIPSTATTFIKGTTGATWSRETGSIFLNAASKLDGLTFMTGDWVVGVGRMQVTGCSFVDSVLIAAGQQSIVSDNAFIIWQNNGCFGGLYNQTYCGAQSLADAYIVWTNTATFVSGNVTLAPDGCIYIANGAVVASSTLPTNAVNQNSTVANTWTRQDAPACCSIGQTGTVRNNSFYTQFYQPALSQILHLSNSDNVTITGNTMYGGLSFPGTCNTIHSFICHRYTQANSGVFNGYTTGGRGLGTRITQNILAYAAYMQAGIMYYTPSSKWYSVVAHNYFEGYNTNSNSGTPQSNGFPFCFAFNYLNGATVESNILTNVMNSGIIHTNCSTWTSFRGNRVNYNVNTEPGPCYGIYLDNFNTGVVSDNVTCLFEPCSGLSYGIFVGSGCGTLQVHGNIAENWSGATGSGTVNNGGIGTYAFGMFASNSYFHNNMTFTKGTATWSTVTPGTGQNLGPDINVGKGVLYNTSNSIQFGGVYTATTNTNTTFGGTNIPSGMTVSSTSTTTLVEKASVQFNNV